MMFSTINARAEEIETKPAFREAFRQRRCLVPVDNLMGPACTWGSGVAWCTIGRPAVCRSFDCRAFAAMGIVEQCAPGHRTPNWEFVGQ